MQSGLSQLDLAMILAETRTVHLLDRRGRGASGPWPDTGVTLEQEVADLTAVAAATGSQDVLGISSGAIIALRAALAPGPVRRVAAFEPPIAVGKSMRLGMIGAFHRQAAAGDTVAAMVTGMKVAEMGPPVMLAMPASLLRAVTRRMLESDDAKELQTGFVHVRELGRALVADVDIVAASAQSANDFAGLGAEVLLLAGTKTRPYLREAVAALATALPRARRVDLPGTNHAATQNRDQWGRPEIVAPAVLEFFCAT
jgi:pimeloyl-ACP methyl ester carboxylesterase